MNIRPQTVLLAIILFLVTLSAQAQLSVETLGVIRHQGITHGEDYGAAVGVGYRVSDIVTIKARAVSYSNDDWRGGVVDEASVLVEARLFQLAKGHVSLYAVGGGDRDFGRDDWGFSVGPAIAFAITKNLSLRLESRIRAWFDNEEDLTTGAGLVLDF